MHRSANALRLFVLLALCLAPPTAADVLLDCDFEDQPLDEPIGTGGAAAHQPVDIGGMPAMVRTSPTGGRALEILDYLDYGTDTVRFELLNTAEITTGVLTFTAVLHFVDFEDYLVYVREPLHSGSSFLDLRFENGGTVSQGDADDFGMFPVGSYTTGEDLLLEIVFDMEAATCAITLDGALIVPAESHGVTGAGVGSILFGFDHDSDLDGHYYLQSVTADHEATATTSRSLGAVKAAWD